MFYGHSLHFIIKSKTYNKSLYAAGNIATFDSAYVRSNVTKYIFFRISFFNTVLKK